MRTKPEFDKKELQADRNDSSGCIWIPLIVVVSYFVVSYIVSAIDHVQRGYGSRLDQIICWGTFIIIGVMAILGILNIGQDSKEVVVAKQEWRRTSKLTEVVIVKRSFSAGGTYEDEYEIPHTVRPRYRLTLKLPNQIDVEADVSESVYKKLENRNTVQIYYKPDSPTTFMLEEEL